MSRSSRNEAVSVVVLALVVAAVGIAFSIAAPRHVIGIGDSLTRGALASSPEHRWADLLGIQADGHDGFTSADALGYPWHVDGATIILVEFGVNDYLGAVPSSTFGRNLRGLVAELPHVRTVLVAAAPPLDHMAAVEPWENYVAEMRAIGETIEIPPLPAADLPDGIHPNDAGEIVWADTIRAALRPPG